MNNKKPYIISRQRRLPNSIVRTGCDEFCEELKKYASKCCEKAVLLVDVRHYQYFSNCNIQWRFAGMSAVPQWAPKVLNLMIEYAIAKAKITALQNDIEWTENEISSSLNN